MADLTIPERLPGSSFAYPAKAGVVIAGREFVALNSEGLAMPVGRGAISFAGMAVHGIDNRDGGDGAQIITVNRSVRGFRAFKVSPGDLNKPVYADAQTLTLEAADGRLKVGVIIGLDETYTWVDLSQAEAK